MSACGGVGGRRKGAGSLLPEVAVVEGEHARQPEEELAEVPAEVARAVRHRSGGRAAAAERGLAGGRHAAPRASPADSWTAGDGRLRVARARERLWAESSAGEQMRASGPLGIWWGQAGAVEMLLSMRFEN